MSNRLGFSNRVRYAIQHDQWGYQEISEPVNWREDDKELKRNTNDNFAGIVSKISASIVFTKRGFETIIAIYQSYGANSTTRLIKEAKDTETDEWYRVWDGTLDFTTLKEEDSMCSCRFNADDLEAIIKSRKSEKYELERTTDLFGNDIEPIDVKTMFLKGRKIFLDSKLGVKAEDRDGAISERQSRSGGRKYGWSAVPVTVTHQSDQNVHNPTKDYMNNNESDGRAELNFYNDANIERELKITITGSMISKVKRIEDVSFAYFGIHLVKYTGAENFVRDPNDDVVLYSTTDVYGMHNRDIQLSAYDQTITILPGESLGLLYFQTAIFPGFGAFRDGEIKVYFDEVDVTISITEDSFLDGTQSNMILPHDAMAKMLEITTGRTNAFYSEALGRTDLGYDVDGIDTGALCGLAHGIWKRQFNTDDDLYKPFTTTIKDFMASYGAVWGLAMGTEKIGFQERIRVEPMEYFYNRNVTVRLGKEIDGKFVYTQVNKMVTEFDEDNYFSEIEVGQDKTEKYEEVQGLDEFNLRSTFSTIINKIQNTLSLISPYNRDATGGELARRKNKESYPTDDTNYDDFIYMEDLKRSTTDVFEQRGWEDDFEVVPEGIYDPSSASNLRLSQVRMILRHGWKIATSLLHYPDDFLRYTSNEGNGNLKTKKVGEEFGYKENEDIPNGDLDRAIHRPEIVTFEHPVSDKLMAHIESNVTILGNTFPAKYGLVEYMASNGSIQKGHLISLKPNKEGKWKLKNYYNLNQ